MIYEKNIFIIALAYALANAATMHANFPAAAAAGAGAAGKEYIEPSHNTMSIEQALAHAKKIYNDAHLNQDEKIIFLKLLDLNFTVVATNLTKPDTFVSDEIDLARRSLRKDLLDLSKTIQTNIRTDQLMEKIQRYAPEFNASNIKNDLVDLMIKSLSFFQELKKTVKQDLAKSLSTTKPAGGAAIEGDSDEA